VQMCQKRFRKDALASVRLISIPSNSNPVPVPRVYM
jgi:hypothetical protein